MTSELQQHHLQAAIPRDLWCRIESWRNDLIGKPSVRQTIIALLEAGLAYIESHGKADAP